MAGYTKVKEEGAVHMRHARGPCYGREDCGVDKLCCITWWQSVCQIGRYTMGKSSPEVVPLLSIEQCHGRETEEDHSRY